MPCTPSSSRTTRSIERIKQLRPQGHHPLRRALSVYVDDAPTVDPEIFELGVPILGICYGAQGIALELGGTVARTGLSEFGKTTLNVIKPGLVLDGMRGEEQCWMSHRDSITEPPPGFEVLAASSGAPVAAMEDRERGFYARAVPPRGRAHAQGHGRAAQLPLQGLRLRPDVHARVDHRGVHPQDPRAGRRRARRSSASPAASTRRSAALLVHRAIGDRLTCVFVDQGMMRMREADRVVETFSGTFGIPLVAVDASDRFLDKLKDVTEPERKRKIIGEEFIRCFEEEARKLIDARFLVQGTLYRDVIESGTRQAAKIKSHHNVGGLPEKMDFELVEPLR